VVPLALVAMAVVQPASPWTFKILGVVGLVTWALAVVLGSRLLRLVAALRVIAQLDTVARGQRTGG
jgi:hypothetical protein